jgi:hypothetical protein
MLTLNLSTVSGQLQSSTATIDRGTRRVCGICGGTAAECLCVTQNPVMLGDDKGKTDGDKDDPHNDVIARLERCLDVVMGDDKDWAAAVRKCPA